VADSDFRAFIPEPGKSRIAGTTARDHAQAWLQRPRAQALLAGWAALRDAPFKGITADGTAASGLFALRDEGAPTEAMIVAARALLARLSPEQRRAACFDVDSRQWRNWQNTELYVEDYGLRLEELSLPVRDAVLDVLRASLSAKGYELSQGVMKLNRFLGDLVNGAAVLNEGSYIFCLFGTPSATEPWGWQFFGHHLCLHCFVVGRQMVLTPAFWGAEPAYADAGPFADVRLFEDEERAGLALIRSLTPEQQRAAIVAHAMVGGDLPEGRRHFADNLHLGGAFHDNRVIPYEGVTGAALAPPQRQKLLDLAAAYMASLPGGPRAARMADIERHLAETRFCWIGGFDEASAFYYRIQSPVVMIEFDHHAGVYLTNPEPAKFHVHTIVRTPNGNDYGRDLLRQHYETAPHHRPHPSTSSG
jgi:hypothetical protein